MTNVVLSFLLAVKNALVSVKHCTWLSFVAITTPNKMRKTNNPYFGRVQKRTRVCGALFNATYIGTDENGNELPKEEIGKEPLVWGVWETYRKIIAHNGKLYMRCYMLPTTHIKVDYLIDGKVATPEQKEEILSYLYKDGESKADARGKLTRTYDLNNVVWLKVNKQTFDKSDYEDVPKVG